MAFGSNIDRGYPLMMDWTDYPNFTEAEMRCKGEGCCGGKADMDPAFMAALQSVRVVYGKPMRITSAYRCPDYDKRIGGAGVHPSSRAADIAVSGEDVYHLLHAAIGMKMRGIGMKQHGPHSGRFMHLDTTDGPMRPRIWTYT